jgi:tetratricopeptide (TPR) repeat protein
VAIAQTNLGVAINKLAELERTYKKLPGYREAAGYAFYVRGEIREKTRDFKKALEDFEVGKAIFRPLARAYPDLPGLHGNLGDACAGLGRTTGALGKADAAKHFKDAASEFAIAIRQSPTDAHLARALKALRTIAP